MKKVVLEGRRADMSWGHLSIDGVERATEVFGHAVWQANDAAVMNPNLLVRVTIEAALRPVVPGSIWKNKANGREEIVLSVEKWRDDHEPPNISYQRVHDKVHCSAWLNDLWYLSHTWVSDP